MDNRLKMYIKSKFGTYAELAKVLNLSEGTVKNALSKNDNVSWLNLIKSEAEKQFSFNKDVIRNYIFIEEITEDLIIKVKRKDIDKYFLDLTFYHKVIETDFIICDALGSKHYKGETAFFAKQEKMHNDFILSPYAMYLIKSVKNISKLTTKFYDAKIVSENLQKLGAFFDKD